MDLEQRLNNAKSKLVKAFAERFGLPTIEIKLVETDPRDFLGKPTYNEEMDRMVEAQMTSREINVGDMILMEYAKDVVETVVVDEIVDGMVYALGDDGEPYCAPLANCDKVPF